MAIIRCNKCKRLFADKAVACPHCGAIFEKDTLVQEEVLNQQTAQLNILDEDTIRIRDDKRRKLDEEKKEKVRLRWEEQEKEKAKNTDEIYLMRFFYVSVFIIFVIIVGFWMYDSPEEIRQAGIEKQKEMLLQAQKAEENRIYDHLKRGRHLLHDMMRDPDSFELIDMYSSTNGAGCYKYRAKNGFGGLNVGIAVYTEAGVLITSDDTELFERSFRENCKTKAE